MRLFLPRLPMSRQTRETYSEIAEPANPIAGEPRTFRLTSKEARDTFPRWGAGMAQEKARNTGGRPRKFHEASRPVTVTLPERTLHGLSMIDKDRARAIVRVVDAVSKATAPAGPGVEVVEIKKGAGYILVGSDKTLKQIPWLQLVEVTPSRYLLSIPTGTAVESLEVAILDLLEHLPPGEEPERKLLLRLREVLKHQRIGSTVSRAEILFVGTRGGGKSAAGA